MITLGRWIECG